MGPVATQQHNLPQELKGSRIQNARKIHLQCDDFFQQQVIVNINYTGLMGIILRHMMR
jgi:hypothetical protein